MRVEQADLLSISDTIILKQRRTYSMREVKAVKINEADFARNILQYDRTRGISTGGRDS